METISFPEALLEGAEDTAETLARIARYRVLHELGFFGVKTCVNIAQGNYKGRFNAGVRKTFSGIYGNVDGCAAGDIEIAAELLSTPEDDVYSAIYDYEIEKNGKEIPD